MSRFFILFVSAVLFFTACDTDDDDDNGTEVEVTGMTAVESSSSVDSTIGVLQTALEANENIGVVATVNHASNAQSVGLSLRPTQVILFGNPSLGTPLMQASQTAGLDLPQKMLVYQEQDDTVIVAYNNAQYLANRHGISDQDQVLNTISNALAGLAENAAGSSVNINEEDDTVAEGEGLVSVQSEFSVDSTYQNLVDAVQAKDALSVMAQLDHQANAASVDMELRPTRLLVFGNPNLGTPLMQNGQSIAIDLPQKILVYEDANGDVFIAYNDPAYLAERHDLEGNEEELNTISNALQNLANTAATSQ